MAHSQRSIFHAPPSAGGWRFVEPLHGFEVTRFRKARSQFQLAGTSTGLGRLKS
jgi:hypothetical protein